MTRRTIWRYLGIGFGTVALASFVVLGVYVYSVSRDLPSVDTLKNYNPPVTTRVYAGNGTVIGEYARERRIFVPIQFVPKRVIDAFISAEDKNFYTHPGIDVGGIILVESALSYLGLGIVPPTPSWGNMLTNATAYFVRAPFLVIPSGVMIFVTVLCLSLIGDGLRDALDPRIRDTK